MTAERVTLLEVHRQPGDCIFTLTLAFDPDRGTEGITFTEFYDYGPLGDDPGREYGYNVHVPYDALAELADALAPDTDGEPTVRLTHFFCDLIHRGVLGDGRPLESNSRQVHQLFVDTGLPATTSTWTWINSD